MWMTGSENDKLLLPILEPLAAAVSRRRILSAAPSEVYAAASRSDFVAAAYDSFRSYSDADYETITSKNNIRHQLHPA